jgi:hypothetical protein
VNFVRSDGYRPIAEHVVNSRVTTVNGHKATFDIGK